MIAPPSAAGARPGLPALAGANSAAHMSQPRWRKRYSATGRHSRHSIPVATATRKLMQRATSKAPPVGSLPFPPVKASRICLASSATFSKVNAASVARLISSKNSQASSWRSMRISIPQTTLKRRHDQGDGYRSPRRGRAHCSSQAHLARAHRHEGGERIDDGRRAPSPGKLAKMTVHHPRQRTSSRSSE